MTLPYDFKRSDRFTIGAKTYRLIKQDAHCGDYYFAAEDDDEHVRILSQEELDTLMTTPAWRHDRGYYDAQHPRRGQNAEARLALASPRQRLHALKMHYFADRLHREIVAASTTLSDASLAAFRERVQWEIDQNPKQIARFVPEELRRGIFDFTVPSPSTLRRHYRIFREAVGDVLAHKPKQPRVQHNRRAACAESREVTYQLIREALTPETRGLSAPAREVVSRLQEINSQRRSDRKAPLYIYSRRQVQRMIAGLSAFERICAQEGIDKARHRFSSYLSGPAGVCLLEVVEIDDWEVDLITLFRDLGLLSLLSEDIVEKLPAGRRWVSVAIDRASRCILGIRIAATPSAEEFRKLLEMVVSDKTELARACGASGTWHQCGRPVIIATDTGASFVASDSIERVIDLGSALQYAAVKCAELRAMIERWFGTLNRTLTPRLPGHTQSNPTKRGDYDAEANACLDDDDLIRILVCYIVDEYHHTPHDGLGGQTPSRRWRDLEQETGFLQPPVDRLTRCAALGIELQLRVGKQGVTVFGNRYSCPELREHYATGIDRSLRVRIDTANLGMVAVEVGGKWVPARPHTKDMEGISLPEWVEECRRLRERYKHEAELSAHLRANAARTIRVIASDARARLRRREATPFGHSVEYVQKLHKTLFEGFRFRDEIDTRLEEAPDGVGREILPATEIEVPTPSATSIPLSLPDKGQDEDQAPIQPDDTWLLEDGR